MFCTVITGIELWEEGHKSLHVFLLSARGGVRIVGRHGVKEEPRAPSQILTVCWTFLLLGVLTFWVQKVEILLLTSRHQWGSLVYPESLAMRNYQCAIWGHFLEFMWVGITRKMQLHTCPQWKCSICGVITKPLDVLGGRHFFLAVTSRHYYYTYVHCMRSMKWLTGHKGGSINRAGTTGVLRYSGWASRLSHVSYRYGVPL